MDLNVIGLSVCTQQALKSMKERGVDDGHIIHINRSVVKSGNIDKCLEWHRRFREVKVPRFRDNVTGCWYDCQPYAPAAFTPRKCSCYTFRFEAEPNAGP